MNDEIVRFRRALITRQHGAAEAAARRDRGHGRTAIHANRIQNLARAPFFDEPARARGGDDVSLQGTSDIESRAIAALRKRDRVREIYKVSRNLEKGGLRCFPGFSSKITPRRGCLWTIGG